jgi:hypothetical protein
MNDTAGYYQYGLVRISDPITWYKARELCQSEQGRNLASFTDVKSEMFNEWLLGGHFIHDNFFIGECEWRLFYDIIKTSVRVLLLIFRSSCIISHPRRPAG